MDLIGNSLKKYKIFASLTALFIIISGSIYLSVQFRMIGKVSDLFFIGLSVAESCFILLNGLWLFRYTVSSEAPFKVLTAASTGSADSEKAYGGFISVFGKFKLILPVSVLWALGSGILPVINNFWNQWTLSVLFGIFLFFANLVTAYFLILLFAYFIYSRKLWNLIEVELWKRESREAHFLFGLSRQISLYGTVYGAANITAWLSSPVIPRGKEVFFIIAASILILTGAIIVPVLPYIHKITAKKRAALIDIDEKIQTEYSEILEKLSNHLPGIRFDRINALLEMRQRIEAIQAFPYKIKTLSTGISIILISSVPIFIQYFFNKFFK